MSAAGLLLSFLNLVLFCALVIFVAFAILWVIKLVFNVTPDGDVLKWGKIVVGLIVVITIIAWLVGAISGVSVVPLRVF